MERLPRLAAGLMIAVLAACSSTPTTSSSTTTSAATETSSATRASSSARPTEVGGKPFRVEEVATSDAPWTMSFLPGTDQALITLKTGTLLLRTMGNGDQIEVSGVPKPVVAGQGGLGDVVPGPTFEDDQTIYLSWVESGDGVTGAVIGRAKLATSGSSASLEGLEIIWRQQPKVDGSGHFSHRMAFSPDGQYLFVSSGERQKFDPAQDLSVNLGKILRLTPDGKAAPGNPFASRGGVSAQIWTYGHRNVLGLEFDAGGNLWASEMGPKGGDELNLITKGKNYGWPKASNGSHYDGSEIPDHRTGDDYEAPKVWWTPSVSPGSLMIYSGDLFPDWTGDAFLGALSGQALIRVDADGTTAKKADQWDMGARIRAVVEGPDGAIYLLEDGNNARLLKLTPP